MKYINGTPYYFIGAYKSDIIVPIIRVCVFIKMEEHINSDVKSTIYYFQDPASFVSHGEYNNWSTPHECILYKLTDISIEYIYDIQEFIDESVLLTAGLNREIPDEVWNEILIDPASI